MRGYGALCGHREGKGQPGEEVTNGRETARPGIVLAVDESCTGTTVPQRGPSDVAEGRSAPSGRRVAGADRPARGADATPALYLRGLARGVTSPAEG